MLADNVRARNGNVAKASCLKDIKRVMYNKRCQLHQSNTVLQDVVILLESKCNRINLPFLIGIGENSF